MSYHLKSGQVETLKTIIKAHGWCDFDIDIAEVMPRDEETGVDPYRYSVSGSLYKTDEDRRAARVAVTTEEADKFFEDLVAKGRIGAFYIEGNPDRDDFSVVTIKDIAQL